MEFHILFEEDLEGALKNGDQLVIDEVTFRILRVTGAREVVIRQWEWHDTLACFIYDAYRFLKPF